MSTPRCRIVISRPLIGLVADQLTVPLCTLPFRPSLVGERSAWLVKAWRAPSRHSRDARVYGHTTMAMRKLSTPPLSPFRPFVLSSFRPFVLSSFRPFVPPFVPPFVVSSFRDKECLSPASLIPDERNMPRRGCVDEVHRRPGGHAGEPL